MTTILLQPINQAATEWHARMEALAGAAEGTSARGHLRRLRDLEELLDDLWQRRRQHVARWFARQLTPTDLVETYRAREPDSPLHVAPVC